MIARAHDRWILCGLALVACESPHEDHDEPIDCDAAIVPLLPLEDDDSLNVDAWRVGDAIAFLIREEHGGPRPRRILILDECGAEPRTIFDHVSAVKAWDPAGPLLARLLPASPGGPDEQWICDPFGGRPNQQLPDDFSWYGGLHSDDLVVQRDDQLFLLPYDTHGLGEPSPLAPTPPGPRCQLVVEGMSYWLTAERQLVADDLASGTSKVVFDDVDECTHTPDQAVILLSRDSGGVQREWAWEPATGRSVDLTETTRADTRGVLLEPQLRMLWLPEDWTTNWMQLAVATAPDGTAFIAADGNLYRVAPDDTEPFWIADGIGDDVEIELSDGAFYLTQRSHSGYAQKLYRVELDGTGFTDVFGQFVFDAIRLTHDRWAFTGERGLYLRDPALAESRLLWPDVPSAIRPMNRSDDTPRDDVIFSGADPDGRNKTIYLVRPDRLE